MIYNWITNVKAEIVGSLLFVCFLSEKIEKGIYKRTIL